VNNLGFVASPYSCVTGRLPYDPAIPLLGTYPKECDTGYSRGTCTPMFIAALFTIAKLWKQPRCPTTDEWINVVSIHNEILCSHEEESNVIIRW
jgi:hypothetical protein